MRTEAHGARENFAIACEDLRVLIVSEQHVMEHDNNRPITSPPPPLTFVYRRIHPPIYQHFVHGDCGQWYSGLKAVFNPLPLPHVSRSISIMYLSGKCEFQIRGHIFEIKRNFKSFSIQRMTGEECDII